METKIYKSPLKPLKMEAIRLEFSKLQIFKNRERWRLYFIVVTEHPQDNDKMVVSTFPDPYIRLKPNQDNFISFEPEGNAGADGLFVIERPMPTDKKVKVRVYLCHSRRKVRDLGKSLSDLKTALGGDAFEIVGELMGTTNPWLIAAKKAFPLLGTILSNLRDRDMGFVSMDESFDTREQGITVLERSNNFSTGEAKIDWKWTIEVK